MNALTAIINGFKQYVDNRLRYVIDQQIEKIVEERVFSTPLISGFGQK